MLNFVRVSALLCLTLLPSVTLAAGEHKAVDILFETRQLDLIEKGREVTYRFERSGSDERLVGKNYADDIRLGVAKVDDKGSRDVVFRVFTGENARDPQNWPELTINPLFIWYLDRAVATFNTLAGGNQMYLKARFREAFRDKAKVEEIKYDFYGECVDAYKITIAPYADDANAKKMQGFENSRFTVIVSEQVPGYFADLQASYISTEAAGPKLDEQIKVVGMGEHK